MNVRELIEELENYGDHVEVKIKDSDTDREYTSDYVGFYGNNTVIWVTS